jgi:hypothetical protein
MNIARALISTFVLVLQCLVLYSMGYNALNWQYWAILLLTVLYMFIYKLME